MTVRRLLPVVVALFAAACTRPRAVPTPPMPPGALGAGPTVAVASEIRIEAPQAGQAVSSPVGVAGRVAGLAPGRQVAAQVRAADAGGGLRWLGNSLMQVDAGSGTFSGRVDYALEAPGAGLVEVMVIDPATGTVLDRQTIAVTLDAEP